MLGQRLEGEIEVLGQAVHATGDLTADMDKFRAFYHDASGKHPQDFGPIRLREESDATAD